jgi:hypothetical protein
MPTREQSPPDIEAREYSWSNGTEAAAPYPVTRTSMAKAAKRGYIPYLLCTLCASLYFLPFMRILLQAQDEGILVYGAFRIFSGQVFARDFFEVVGPGTFYWLALFLKLFGATFVATRVCVFVSSLGTALGLYYLSRRICSRYRILPCILLAGTYFGSSWPAVSHHVDSNCFALLSIACVTAWQAKRRHNLLFAAGALAGATTCFLQPKGVLLLVALWVWLWIERWRNASWLRPIGLVTAGYATVVGFMLVYFWSRHALWDLVYANAVWPSVHYSAVNVVPYAQGMIRDYWDHFVIANTGFHWTVVMAAVLITPFLFIAALPVLLPVLAAQCRKNAVRPEVVLYWLCGLALWLSEIHRKDICHLVFGSALLLVLCVYYLEQYRAKIASLTLQLLAISGCCLAGFNFFLVLAAHPMATRVGTVRVFKPIPILDVLDDKVAPGEVIFAYPYCPTYYFLSGTTNPTRYGALVYNFDTPEQFDQVAAVLELRRVRYAVWDTTYQANIPGASPRVSPDQLVIEPYLESHYRLVKEEDGVRLMERKDEAHAN